MEKEETNPETKQENHNQENYNQENYNQDDHNQLENISILDKTDKINKITDIVDVDIKSDNNNILNDILHSMDTLYVYGRSIIENSYFNFSDIEDFNTNFYIIFCIVQFRFINFNS